MDIITKLKALAFTEYEARVFVALLEGNVMTASEIADSAGVRRTDVYPILKSFVEKGYCNEIETNAILNYEMIDPDIIFDKLEAKLKKIRDEEMTNLKSTFKDLKPRYKSKQSDKSGIINIELIRGVNKHRVSKFMKLVKEAKKEILFMIRLEHSIPDDIDETAKRFIQKGGIIRSIYEASPVFKSKKAGKWSVGTLNDLVRMCAKFETYGEKVKLSTERVPNMTIFDRRIVFLNFNDKRVPRHNEADIIVYNEDFALNMVRVFESYWKESLTVKNFKKEYLQTEKIGTL